MKNLFSDMFQIWLVHKNFFVFRKSNLQLVNLFKIAFSFHVSRIFICRFYSTRFTVIRVFIFYFSTPIFFEYNPAYYEYQDFFDKNELAIACVLTLKNEFKSVDMKIVLKVLLFKFQFRKTFFVLKLF